MASPLADLSHLWGDACFLLCSDEELIPSKYGKCSTQKNIGGVQNVKNNGISCKKLKQNLGREAKILYLVTFSALSTTESCLLLMQCRQKAPKTQDHPMLTVMNRDLIQILTFIICSVFFMQFCKLKSQYKYTCVIVILVISALVWTYKKKTHKK